MLMILVIGIYLMCMTVQIPVVHAGAESRCTTLGAHCLASEPFNTNTYTTDGSNDYNPGDTSPSDKEGSMFGAGYPIWSPNFVPSGATTGDEAFNALPAGHSLTYVFKTANNWGGSLNHGHSLNAGPNSILTTTYAAQVNVRFYVYHSSVYDFSGENACTNGKLAQIGRFTDLTVIIDGASSGPSNLRDFTGWEVNGNTTLDCCVNGPIANAVPGGGAFWKGHWVRVEIIQTNRSGGVGGNIYVYLTQMGSNEFLWIDTEHNDTVPVGTLSGATFVGWDHTLSHGIQTGIAVQYMSTNLHRSAGCNGSQAVSHLMVAGWDTIDLVNNRIGAASAIEGGGGGGGSSGSGGGFDLVKNERY